MIRLESSLLFTTLRLLHCTIAIGPSLIGQSRKSAAEVVGPPADPELYSVITLGPYDVKLSVAFEINGNALHFDKMLMGFLNVLLVPHSALQQQQQPVG